MTTHPLENRTQDKLEIGVLYGFRALMVLFVCNFHIWQQGWMGQYFTLFGHEVDFDFWTRSGYVFVDGMLLLSGFLLFLPYARHRLCGTPVMGTGRFYWNRLVRIVPSYLFSVLVMLFFIALPSGAYNSDAARNKDLLTHFTFTFTFFRDTYLYSKLNVVLWTVGIEMQFYLVFPFLARAAEKKPVLTLSCMAVSGVMFRLIVARQVSDLSMWLNQLPSFLDVYALGMLGALLYVRISARVQRVPPRDWRRAAVALASVVVFAAGCLVLIALLRLQTDNGLKGYDELRLSQWMVRLPLAVTLLAMMLSAAFLPRVLQKLLDNRLMRFLAAISFNFYIWHQVLSVQLATGLFPSTLHSDQGLQRAFTLMCYALSTVIAMAVTYGVEKPAARGLERLRQNYVSNKERKEHERSAGRETL